MNFFMLWINEKGEKELITPPLDGTILPGVTRNSIISLVKAWGGYKVSESPIEIGQVLIASKEKRIIEMFGAGTAAIVSPIKRVHFDGTDVIVPLDPSNPEYQAGPLTRKLADHIMGIQYGEIKSDWSVVID
jgi:branched-chain amino acid aminotransferase